MTVRPVLGANRADGDVVTATDWNRDVAQNGNWAQEVILGTNADKIPATAISGAVGYYPNILVNGGMEINQRGVATYSAVATPITTLDRWAANVSTVSAAMAIQQVAAVDTGSQYCAAVNYIHAAGQAGVFYQNVENWQEFKGKTVQLSARVSANGTGMYMYLTDGVASTAGARTANGLTTLTQSLTVATNATTLQAVFRCDASVFAYVDNVMLAMAPAPIDYVQRPSSEEWLLAKRYYQKVKVTARWRSAAAGEVRDAGIVFPVGMAGTPTGVVTAGTRTNIGSASLLDITSDGARMEYAATAATADTSALNDIVALEYNP